MYRLISNLIIVSLLIFSAHKVFAYKNDFALKAGFVYSKMKFNKLDEDISDEMEEKLGIDEQDETTAFGLHTSFSYTWERIDIGAESKITIGKEAELSFAFEDEEVRGQGNVMSVDITPFIKLHSKTFNFSESTKEKLSALNLSPLYAYFKIGPSWMIQTVNLDDFNIRSEIRANHKISYESFGLNISLGIEENLEFKNLHPVFFEVSVSAYESYKVTLVDRSDQKEINILQSKDAKQDIKTFQLMFILGMTLF